MAYDLRETLRYIESQHLHTGVGLPVIVNNSSKYSTRSGAVSERFLQVSFLSLSSPEMMKLKLAEIVMKRPQTQETGKRVKVHVNHFHSVSSSVFATSFPGNEVAVYDR